MAYSYGSSSSPVGGGTSSPFIATTDANWNIYSPRLGDDVAKLQAQVDRMEIRLDEALTLMEKLEIETRYWRLKAEVLSRMLEGRNDADI